MKVLVTGASGFTGTYVVSALRRQGVAVRAFLRPGGNPDVLRPAEIELASGDLDNPGSLQAALSGVDALVNIASLGFGHAPGIVGAAENAGIRRALFISSTSIFTRLESRSQAVRLQAEEIIGRSGLAWTILRPTMIYGSARDRNMCRLIRYLRRWPLIPVFGSRAGLQQPVYVGDVALAVSRALTSAATIGKAYNIPGKQALTLDQIIDVIARRLGRRIRKVHLPGAPVAALLSLMEKAYPGLPIKAEQIRRLDEDKSFDYSDASRDFDYRPRSFEEGIALELAGMDLI